MPKGRFPVEIAEEARLIFVAMTRAKEQLHLTHCRKRDASATFKQKSHDLKASSFINCLPKDKIDKQFHPAK
jgi:superfamily I DNA/RNA helicase